MPKIKIKVAKQTEGQALRDILRANIKKFRSRRNWSQFTLAAKTSLSTNFLADIEAGNTWVSAQTLIKLAEVFEIEPFELLKPEKETKNPASQGEFDEVQALISRFSRDVTSVVQDSVEKAVKHVKKQYKIE